MEGSFPLRSACSQKAVHRGSPCGHTAVRLALGGQPCVGGANYKEKFTRVIRGQSKPCTQVVRLELKKKNNTKKNTTQNSLSPTPAHALRSVRQVPVSQHSSYAGYRIPPSPLLFVWLNALVCLVPCNAACWKVRLVLQVCEKSSPLILQSPDSKAPLLPCLQGSRATPSVEGEVLA